MANSPKLHSFHDHQDEFPREWIYFCEVPESERYVRKYHHDCPSAFAVERFGPMPHDIVVWGWYSNCGGTREWEANVSARWLVGKAISGDLPANKIEEKLTEGLDARINETN